MQNPLLDKAIINPTIFNVSDGTGETAMSIVRAVKVQFGNAEINVERFNKVRHREQLEEILVAARKCSATVVMTLVDPDLRIFLISRSMQLGLKIVDVLFPLLETLSNQIGKRPNAIPGLLRRLDEDYFKRITAIEYTVRHDDGLGFVSSDLSEADIILIGVSRTSKTPLSMYLGHKGYKVANIPIIHNIEPPEELFTIDQNKIVALIIDPSRLAEIRTARIETLGGDSFVGDYADLKEIYKELEWSRDIFKRNKRWSMLNVTGKAIEENAVEIEKIILEKFPHLTED